MSDAQTTITPGDRRDAPTDKAPASRPRPPQAGALSASLAFAWRSLLKIKHVPEQLGDVIGIPILFTLMFTYLFGGALAGSTGHYLQFLLPGTRGPPDRHRAEPIERAGREVAVQRDAAVDGDEDDGQRQPRSSAASSATPAATCSPPAS